MSSQHRPTATGVVINADTILITFPDAGTFAAKLVAPGTIRRLIRRDGHRAGNLGLSNQRRQYKVVAWMR